MNIPSLAQMRIALAKQSNPDQLMDVGVNEMPDVFPKIYVQPDKGSDSFPPPGGVRNRSPEMPIGGIDTDPKMPGQQLMPQSLMQPQQQQGQPEQPQQPTGGAPQAPQAQQSNILSLTPQGQALSALKPVPQSMNDGGSVGITPNEHQFEVSTRFPTAIKASENPIKSKLLVGLDAAAKDPKGLEHNINLMRSYPGSGIRSSNTKKAVEEFVEHAKDNLLYLYDLTPENIRNRSKLWYDGANKIANRWKEKYGISDSTAAGVLASLSPQKDWFMNVSLAKRVLDTLKENSNHRWDSEMEKTSSRIWAKPQYAPIVNALRNKKLQDLTDPVEKAMWIRTFDESHNPRHHMVITPEGDESGIRLTGKGEPVTTGWGSLNEIAKAISMHDNPSYENISRSLGGMHKVRSFYNNILSPNSRLGHTTIDTHAVAAALNRPLAGTSEEVKHNFGGNELGKRGPINNSFLGLQGTYPLFHEAYKRAAKEKGILPREMQSITWEAIRGLYPDVLKRNEQIQHEANEIWSLYSKGLIPADLARAFTQHIAGGIDVPKWHK